MKHLLKASPVLMKLQAAIYQMAHLLAGTK